MTHSEQITSFPDLESNYHSGVWEGLDLILNTFIHLIHYLENPQCTNSKNAGVDKVRWF